MRKKIFVLILLIFPFTSFFSCEHCEKGDPYFDIHGLGCQIYYKSPDLLPDGGFTKLTNGQEAVPFNGHYIDVHFEANYYSHQEKNTLQFHSQAAYARKCDFLIGHAGSEEGLDTLYVITINAYDENHKASDTINDIISMGGWVNYYNGYKDYSGAISLEEYVSTNKHNIQQQSTRIRLNEEPQYKQESHAFIIIFELLNGERYTAETNEVLFE